MRCEFEFENGCVVVFPCVTASWCFNKYCCFYCKVLWNPMLCGNELLYLIFNVDLFFFFVKKCIYNYSEYTWLKVGSLTKVKLLICCLHLVHLTYVLLESNSFEFEAWKEASWAISAVVWNHLDQILLFWVCFSLWCLGKASPWQPLSKTMFPLCNRKHAHQLELLLVLFFKESSTQARPRRLSRVEVRRKKNPIWSCKSRIWQED